MSRQWRQGWAMCCDSCNNRSETRHSQDDIPLVEFAHKGWFIGNTCDLCPACHSKANNEGKELRGRKENDKSHFLKLENSTIDEKGTLVVRASISCSVPWVEKCEFELNEGRRAKGFFNCACGDFVSITNLSAKGVYLQ